jgi:hypothetical protein
MRVLILKDYGAWKAGDTVSVDWSQAIRLVQAGIARRLTWKDSILAK